MHSTKEIVPIKYYIHERSVIAVINNHLKTL